MIFLIVEDFKNVMYVQEAPSFILVLINQHTANIHFGLVQTWVGEFGDWGRSFLNIIINAINSNKSMKSEVYTKWYSTLSNSCNI